MAKKALIGNQEVIHYSTQENYGLKVHQIEDAENVFSVAEPIFRWVDCPDNLNAETCWYGYNESNGSFVDLPADVYGSFEEETPPA